jgi:hypothetical protein
MTEAKVSVIDRVKNRYHWRRHLRHDRKATTEQEPLAETAMEIAKIKAAKREASP